MLVPGYWSSKAFLQMAKLLDHIFGKYYKLTAHAIQAG
jgi:hypothetical protein